MATPSHVFTDAEPSLPLEDGRRNRRERNRESVVSAMLSLFDQRNFSPSAEEIAAEAGLSARSIFRYFDDIDDLCRAAISRQLERVLPTLDFDAAPGQPLDVRIDSVVRQRLGMFDAMGPVGQVA